jgi:uncharacterized membrane protein YcfT
MSRDDATSRLDWVDVAKGICIVLVVMMHSTFGVERTIGTSTSLHGFIDWARPFRMPDFFLISGLFLAARIDRPWRAYLDTKVVHFAYFYVLWLNIQFAMKAPAMVRELGLNGAASAYLLSYVQPFGTLWFIYLLALFFVATKLLRDVPKPVVLIGAAILHVLAPHTVSLVVDEFADRFVFFYAGYAAAPLLLALADRIAHQPAPLLLAGLMVWAWVNWLGVESELALAAWSDLPFAFAGILAVITSSVLLARSGAVHRADAGPAAEGPADVARRHGSAGDDSRWGDWCIAAVPAGSRHADGFPVRQAKDRGVDHQPAARDVAFGLQGTSLLACTRSD